MKGKCIIVMGVSGSGKSTIAIAISHRMGAIFLEGDDFHSQSNIDKMAHGHPLTDADRADWLRNIHLKVKELTDQGKDTVVSCSALKRNYRQTLSAQIDQILFVYLKGSFALIHSWMVARKDHFMPVKLLKSQFDTLEEPTSEEKNAVTVHLQPNLKKEKHIVFEKLRARNFM